MVAAQSRYSQKFSDLPTPAHAPCTSTAPASVLPTTPPHGAAPSGAALHHMVSGHAAPPGRDSAVRDVAGHDTTLGYSSRVGHPARESAPIVRLLRDAGALVYAKTTLPTGCLSFEVSSDVFGRTTNPHNPAFSPGASTGGGAALLAWQGSMVEVGTDIGGSTRYPAAYCGLYAVKGSHGRFPSHGCEACLPGLDAVPTITAPLARTLGDLEEFWQRVVSMRPWEYDHTVRVSLP